MTPKQRDECKQRAFVALANVGSAQESTRRMRKAPPDVVGLLDQAQSALRYAIERLQPPMEGS